jgi:ABC-2 type transport system permease protein
MTLYLNEMVKLRTVRSTYYLLLVAQAIIVIGVSGAFASGNAPDDIVVVRGVAHVGLTSLFALVLGILAMAGEYRHRTITDTFLSSPRRGSVVAAKLGVASTLGVLFGIVGAFTALASSWVWAVLKDIPFAWSSAALWQTLGGAVVWNALFAAIGVGIGALIRNVAGAVAAALAWLALVEGLVGQLLGASLARWLPFQAGSALGRLPLNDALAQWTGGVVLVAYSLVFALLAVFVNVRRDVA